MGRRIGGGGLNGGSSYKQSIGCPRPLRASGWPGAEQLEPRTLLDAVFWDGGAGTSNWNDPANWNRNGVDALPQHGDDVIIDVPANPTITVGWGDISLASLVSNEAITVTGGALRLLADGDADINATLNINGGTISGGRWDVTGGVLRGGSASTSILDGLTITGDVTLGGNQHLRIANGIAFTDNVYRIRLTGASASSLAFIGDNTLSTGGISFENTQSSSTVGVVGGTLTLGPDVVVSGGRGAIGFGGESDASIVNRGVIISRVAGASLRIAPGGAGTFTNDAGATLTASNAGILQIGTTTTSWSSDGTISATGPARIIFSGVWSSTGDIVSDGATLEFGGTFDYSSLDNRLARNGGTLTITGVMTNEGRTVRLDDAPGAWRLFGGSINGGAAGGVIEASEGSPFVIVSGAVNILDRQTFAGADIEIGSGAQLRIANGIAFSDPSAQTIRMSASGFISRLLFIGDGELPGDVVVEGAVSSSVIGLVESGTLTIPPGVTVSGSVALGEPASGAHNRSYVNHGTLTFANSSSIAPLGDGTFTNVGSVRIQQGTLVIGTALTAWQSSGEIFADPGTTLRLLGGWSNTGFMTATGASVELNGSFSAASVGAASLSPGGTVTLVGRLDNEGQTLTLTRAMGTWDVNGGAITGGAAGGSLAFEEGALRFTSNPANTLENQRVVIGDLSLGNNSRVRIVDGLAFVSPSQRIRIAGSGARAYFAGDSTLSVGGIHFAFTGDLAAIEGGTLTLGPDFIITGSGGRLGVSGDGTNSGLVLRGSIRATGGQTFTIIPAGAGAFTNAGSIVAAGGAISIGAVGTAWSSTGTLGVESGGSLSLNGEWTSTGQIGVNTGTLNLGGTFPSSNFASGFTRDAGTVNLVGSMSNEGGTFTFDAATGAWDIRGGTIDGGVSGGAIAFSSKYRPRFVQGGTIVNQVVIGGDLVIDGGEEVSVRGGLAFAVPDVQRIRIVGAGLLSVTGDWSLPGNLSFESPLDSRGTISTVGGTLTIPAGRTVSGGRGFIVGSLTNHGTIRTTVAGAYLLVRGYGGDTFVNTGMIGAVGEGATMAVGEFAPAWVNVGTISSAAGARVDIGGTWSSTGLLQVDHATLQLGGSFDSDVLSGITRNAGDINIVGFLRNEGRTVEVSAVTGSMNLLGGTIDGGATGGFLRYTDGFSLTHTHNEPGHAGQFVNQTILQGDLFIGVDGALRIEGALAFADPASQRIRFDGGSLYLPGNWTLPVDIFFEGSESWVWAWGANATLTIPAGRTVSGGTGSFFDPDMRIVNYGAIIADVPGQSITLGSRSTFSRVTNFGSITATGGGIVNLYGQVFLAGPVLVEAGSSLLANVFDNSYGFTIEPTGSLTMQDGNINIGGRLTLQSFGRIFRTGGVATFSGTLNNPNATFELNAQSGSWRLDGARIIGTSFPGSIRLRDGATLEFTVNGSLLNRQVVLEGDLVLGADAVLSIQDVSFANPAQQRVRMVGAGNNTLIVTTLFTDVVFEATSGVSTITPPAAQTLTISANVRVSGRNGRLYMETTSNAIVNNGVISADPTGTILITSKDTAPFSNNGVVEALDAARVRFAPLVTITNLSGTTLDGGVWRALDGASIIFPTAVSIHTNNAAITIASNAVFSALLPLIANRGALHILSGGEFSLAPFSGTLTNTGELTLAPGAALSVTGWYRQTSAGRLIVQVGGVASGDAGTLAATGTVTLDGSLEVQCVNGWTPSPAGHTFIRGATLMGTFQTTALPPPPPGLQTFLRFTGTEVRFIVSSVADYDHDGVVNSQDFFNFLTAFFSGDADFNNDGVVNSQDFFEFLTVFFSR